jgi:hypothetical protein
LVGCKVYHCQILEANQRLHLSRTRPPIGSETHQPDPVLYGNLHSISNNDRACTGPEWALQPEFWLGGIITAIVAHPIQGLGFLT